MSRKSVDFKYYYSHLRNISLLGRIYKKFFASQVIFYFASRFGYRIVEVGSGTGSGVLGAFPKYVSGLDINPAAVDYCCSQGMSVGLIQGNGTFPFPDSSFDACVLDNVLEHIENPRQTLNECYRITSRNGGLIIVVPGVCGYKSDSDHRIFYSEQDLNKLDERWLLTRLVAMPFLFKSMFLSKYMRQYCLVAEYRKI